MSAARRLIAEVIRTLERGSYSSTDDIGQTQYTHDGGTVKDAIVLLKAARRELK